MNITLEIITKFNDGQEVYIIDDGYVDYEKGSKWRVFGPSKIVGVEIYIRNRETDIIYKFNEEYSESEEFCFATKEDAQKECNRRNNENSIIK